MTATYEIENNGSIVVARYSGFVTGAEVLTLFARYFADPEFCFARPHLVDTSAVTGSDAGFSELFALFSRMSRSYEASEHTLRIAIYAPDEFTFGLARIIQNLAESSDQVVAEVFTESDSARRWALAKEA